jgi:capsular exopolysaccharide synthesis family protein
MSDRVIRSSEQVESLLHADCIALVPLLTTSKDPAKPVSRPEQTEKRRFASSLLHSSSKTTHSFALNSDSSGVGGATDGNSSLADMESKVGEPLQNDGQKFSSRKKIVHDDRAIWAVVDAPLSRYTEAIRSIKLANDLKVMDKTNRIVGLTSSLPDEGKSTIAFSLAQLMSQVGARTILVDCDLRNPSLSRTLAPRAKIGLIDVIAGKTELEEAILHEPLTNLEFLPGVVKHRLVHSTEILTSIPLKNLFEKLRAKYDYVVVDLPPLAPVVDVRAATHLIDSFVFVIEWGRTKIDVVEHALEQAHGVYDNLLGVVLNKVDMDSFGRYANNREDFYYNKHYARYGYTE